VYTFELAKMVRARNSLEGAWTGFNVFGLRRYPRIAMGQLPVTMGASLVGQLLYLNLKGGVPVVTNTGLKELVMKDGRVVGAVLEQGGKEVTVNAEKGVVLAAGGFAKNDAMRKEFQAAPITASWSSASPADTGDAITAASKVGAATALMDSAWWGAATVDPTTGQSMWCLYDRVLPHSIIVDQTGVRYMNESGNYNSIGRAIWERNKTSPAIPSFVIVDSNHRKRYVLAGKFMPGITPQSAIDSGYITKAQTISEMAEKLGVSSQALNDTVDRFNASAKEGVDGEFHRGESRYDQFMGDPNQSPNRNLGALVEPPFYALKVWPGDLGTKGGVVTDEHARALQANGRGGYKVIEGLYAVGNSSASVMGMTYAGAGATLGPALTFAYIAANHAAGNASA
jgi:succinate dehydrogenase/fumarate reductase flavoprotein subunit